MITLILSFLPDQFLPIILVGIGVLLMLGIINSSIAFSILGTILLFVLLSPFIDALFNTLPTWLLLLILIVILFSIPRIIMTAFFGKEAAGHIIGSLFISLFSMPFRFIGYLIRARR